MIFTGKVLAGSRISCHQVKLNEFPFPLCYGTLYKKVGLPRLNRHTLYEHDYQFAWGYDGINPQLLAATMLAVAMGIDFDETAFSDAGDNVPIASVSHIGGWDIKSGGFFYKWNDLKPPAYCDNIPAMVKKLYKKFSEKIVANLPDNWEMSTDEILRWIENNKPKQRKQNERAGQKTTGGAEG